MKVLFLINSLEGGGAEKILAMVARETEKRRPGWTVEVATLDDMEDKYPLSVSIKRYRMDSDFSLKRSFINAFRLVKAERPDVIVAFLTRSNLIAAVLGKFFGTRTLISERVNTSSHFANRKGSGLYRFMIRYLYPLAEKTLCVSSGVKRDLEQNFGMNSKQTVVINNPVDIEGLIAASQGIPALTFDAPYIVSVGRLMPNKNFAGLIDAYHQANVGLKLVILGEGPERENLERQIAELGLSGRVHLPGYVSNPHAIMANAVAYVSASLAEGFPNALVEAMAIGLPVVSTDCDSGPADILDGKDDLKVRDCHMAQFGILVPIRDVSAMKKAIVALDDPDTRRKYAELARHRAADYSVDRAMEKYLDVIEG